MLTKLICDLEHAGKLKLSPRLCGIEEDDCIAQLPSDVAWFIHRYDGGKFEYSGDSGRFVKDPFSQSLADYLIRTGQGEFPEFLKMVIFARLSHALGGNSLVGTCLEPGKWFGWTWHMIDDPFCEPTNSCYLEFPSFTTWLSSVEEGTQRVGKRIPFLRGNFWDQDAKKDV